MSFSFRKAIAGEYTRHDWARFRRKQERALDKLIWWPPPVPDHVKRRMRKARLAASRGRGRRRPGGKLAPKIPGPRYAGPWKPERPYRTTRRALLNPPGFLVPVTVMKHMFAEIDSRAQPNVSACRMPDYA